MNVHATATAQPSTIQIIAAIGVGTVASMAANMVPALIATVAQLRGLSESQAGLTAMADNGGYAVGMVGCALLPALVQRLGWRKTTASGLALLIIANLASVVAVSLAPYLIARALAGIGAGIAMSIGFAVFGESKDSARAMASFNVVGLGVPAVGIPYVSVVASQYGLGKLFGIFAGLGALGLLLVPLLPRMSLREAVVEEAHAGHVSERITAVGWLAISSALFYSIAMMGVYAYLEFMGSSWGNTQETVEHGVSSTMYASMAAALLASVIGSHFGFLKPLLAGFAGLCVAIAMFLVLKPVAAFLAVCVLFGFSTQLIVPYQFEAVTRVDPSSSAAMMVNAVLMGGLAAGPAIAGYFVTPDYRVVNGMALGGMALSVALMLLALRRHSRAPTSSAFAMP